METDKVFDKSSLIHKKLYTLSGILANGFKGNVPYSFSNKSL